MKFKIILPAGDIPLNVTVTKRTGRKEYRLCCADAESKIPLATADEHSDEHTVLLVDERGGISACSKATELVWIVEKESFRLWLDGSYHP